MPVTLALKHNEFLVVVICRIVFRTIEIFGHKDT